MHRKSLFGFQSNSIFGALWTCHRPSHFKCTYLFVSGYQSHGKWTNVMNAVVNECYAMQCTNNCLVRISSCLDYGMHDKVCSRQVLLHSARIMCKWSVFFVQIPWIWMMPMKLKVCDAKKFFNWSELNTIDSVLIALTMLAVTAAAGRNSDGRWPTVDRSMIDINMMTAHTLN